MTLKSPHGDRGYSSDQLGRLNTSHQTEVQSLEISIMAREKTLLHSVVGENLQRHQKGQ